MKGARVAALDSRTGFGGSPPVSPPGTPVPSQPLIPSFLFSLSQILLVSPVKVCSLFPSVIAISAPGSGRACVFIPPSFTRNCLREK